MASQPSSATSLSLFPPASLTQQPDLEISYGQCKISIDNAPLARHLWNSMLACMSSSSDDGGILQVPQLPAATNDDATEGQDIPVELVLRDDMIAAFLRAHLSLPGSRLPQIAQGRP